MIGLYIIIRRKAIKRNPILEISKKQNAFLKNVHQFSLPGKKNTIRNVKFDRIFLNILKMELMSYEF